jgi:hypothetical protein
MLKVEEVIGDLLLHHTCVIIPDFGGFVAKPISAKVDVERGSIFPPSKQLLFNKHLISNDGLLISEFSNKNKISFLDSENHVSDYVNTIKETLKNFRNYSLPKVGTFQLDEEGNINFEQDRHFNLLLNAYGLSQVQFIANPLVKEEKETIVVEKSAEIIKSGKRNLWKYAAAACFLPLAFYSIWIPVKSDVLQSGLISYKDFNPFYRQESGLYSKKPLTSGMQSRSVSKKFEEKLTLIENSDLASFKLFNDNTVLVEVKKEAAPSVQQPKEINRLNTIQPSKVIQNSSSKFDYVVGCFANKSNADNFKLKLQNEGFQVHLNSTGSLIRVIIGGAGSSDSLQTIISKANALGYQGWILKN